MSFLCLWTPDWGSIPLERLAPVVLERVPRVALDAERGVIWADGRTLDAPEIAAHLITRLSQQNVTNARVGISLVPVAAELAARGEGPGGVGVVAPGQERSTLAGRPITDLRPSPPLANLFDGVGIETCGDLALLEQEWVEIRFGAEGVHLWRLARADDPRLIFAAMPRSLPEASLDWVDYTLSDPERLVFVINALVDNVAAALTERGLAAREMTLVFSLANRTSYEHPVRPSRSTASRKAWMRLIRTHLERIELADSVTGIRLSVESVTGEAERQGDIFDRGFATARATEETVAQLLDDQGAVIVVPENSAHPLLERRTTWQVQEPAHAARSHVVRPYAAPSHAAPSHAAGTRGRPDPQLTLQLFPEPRRIVVQTVRRRDHELPVRYRDGDGWIPVARAAGPDRVSGSPWDRPFAREYFRCVTGEGALVWLYRDGGEWYLQGVWD